MKKQWLAAAAAAWMAAGAAWAQDRELRFCLRAEPKTLHPLQVLDEASDTVRYLTGGVLLRVNRKTQNLEPELAAGWKIAADGKSITFHLRQGLVYSDGTPFTAEDVAHTFRLMMDPETKSPLAEPFRAESARLANSVRDVHTITLTLAAPIGGVERLFDQIVILSAKSPLKERAVLGPFRIAEHKPGAYIQLTRNPNYWKKDSHGRQLPHLDSIRLEIQTNRDAELLRYQRGQIHLINSVDPDHFDRLAASAHSGMSDVGPSLDAEFLWFNQAPQSPVPAHKRAWFTSQHFRRAVSGIIRREDLVRVVFRGHGTAAAGPCSPANQLWFHGRLKPHTYDEKAALRRLAEDGFQLHGGRLVDRHGNPVEFSVITNAGNRTRERMASMIQQDLSGIGIKLNIVTLDFPSLIERIGRSLDYEACLLGFVNVDGDPNGQMNVWLSSSSQHAWNPSQKSPATPWEAELDRLMRAQSREWNMKKRKALYDKVQEIVWDQAPIIYLVHKNVLVGVSPALKNAAPSVFRPQTFWNPEHLSLAEEKVSRR
jgi:peptide/nickel transport system substrate-binding protein